MYSSEADEFSSMSMGSDDLEAFGMPSDDGCSYGQGEEYYSIEERCIPEEPYEMSSDELSVEDGENCVDDFGIEMEEDELMSYADFQAAQRNDDDDSMEEADPFRNDEQEDEHIYIWDEREQREEEEYSSDCYSYDVDDSFRYYGTEDEESRSDDFTTESMTMAFERDLKELSWFDRNAFGLTNICYCENCMAVIHDIASVKSNSCGLTELVFCPSYTQHFTDEGWQLLGRYIGNNNQLSTLDFTGVALTDGITSLLSAEMHRNRSVENINFTNNSLGIEGIRGLESVLRASTKLVILCFNCNRFGDKGFEIISTALHSRPVRYLLMDACDIKEVTISDGFFPKYLDELSLCYNTIDSVGCLALAHVLQRKDSTLKKLLLRDNFIDDEGARILSNSLRTNTSLMFLDLQGNPITGSGHKSFFSLVNGMASISATLASNHTLEAVEFGFNLLVDEDESHFIEFEEYVDACLFSDPAKLMKEALIINSNSASPQESGRKKVINTQLNIIERDVCSRLQGVQNNVSLFADVDCPLHLLPEILALIGENHGLSEMFAATLTSISTLISLPISKEERLKTRRDNLSLDMEDVAGEIKALLLADRFSREDYYRKENLMHEMGCIFQELVELDRELSSYSQEGRA